MHGVHAPDARALTGRSQAHLTAVPDARDGERLVHSAACTALAGLGEAARREGFELRVRSGYRTFAAQARIWNDKASGRRPLYDDAGLPLDPSGLDAPALMAAILRWSALPGASRHHWGTDFDVYDGRAEDAGCRIELLPQEAAAGGACADFAAWLADAAARFDFFRPYERDLGGVAPEWWHVSFAPVAVPWLERTTVDVLRDAIEGERAATPLLLEADALAALESIRARYVANVADGAWA